MRRKTVADYHKLAAEHGLRWIATLKPRNVQEYTDWECENGHVWRTRYWHIKKGVGCPFCAGNARKTAEEYHALADRHGLTWREDLYGERHSVNDPMLWELPSGVIFVDTYHNLDVKQIIVSQKPHHSMRRRVTKEEIESGEWRKKWRSRSKT